MRIIRTFGLSDGAVAATAILAVRKHTTEAIVLSLAIGNFSRMRRVDWLNIGVYNSLKIKNDWVGSRGNLDWHLLRARGIRRTMFVYRPHWIVIV